MTRPFVFINSAMSADGKISTIDRRQVRISSQVDLARVDRLRAESDAIMVGIGTVLADDPGLRVKSDLLRRARRYKGLSEDPFEKHPLTQPLHSSEAEGREILSAAFSIQQGRCSLSSYEHRPYKNMDLIHQPLTDQRPVQRCSSFHHNPLNSPLMQ